MAKLSPIGNNAQFINGIPANGAKLFWYAAGSSTKQTTYTDEAGLTPQSNPIILDSRGEPSQPIWLTEGLSYKCVFASSTDTDPPSSPIWDIDDITGINDASLTIDQWVDSGLVPTYVSATSFTVPGDQTSIFLNKRRLKSSVTAGTAYSTVSTAVFGALTTVTVVNDSTPLDSGLSSVQLGLLTSQNTSIPSIVESYRATVAATATTTPLWTSTAQIQDWTGTPIITDLPDAPQPGVWREVYPATGTIFTDNANLDVQGDTNYTVESGDKVYIEALTISTFKVWADKKSGEALNPNTSYIQPITASVGSNALTITLNPTVLDFRSSTIGSGTVNTRTVSSAINVVVSSGSTLGTTNAVQNRLAVLAIDNAGTVELAVVNVLSGLFLNEGGLISTTAEGGAGGADSSSVIYSTTARSNVPYRVVGYIESTQATAGTWATAPSLIQGVGGQSEVHGYSCIRLNTANGIGSTNTAIRRFSNTVINRGTDITYADSATLGASFTINTPGVYAIAYADVFSASNKIGLSLNSTQLTTAIQSITASDILIHSSTYAADGAASVAVTVALNAGDVVRPHNAVSVSTGTLSIPTFTITRVA